jgi:diguanylate cyclase
MSDPVAVASTSVPTLPIPILRLIPMLGRFKRPSENKPPEEAPDRQLASEMALDTLAGILRSLAEFALEQEGADTPAFRCAAEAWAKHITLATSPPGAPEDDAKTRKGRREWEGVRRFVRDYCQASFKRVCNVTADLRQVIWVFIRSISQAFAEDEQIDERLRMQMVRLEQLVEGNATADLKREVLDAIGMLRVVLDERKQRQHRQMQQLGAQVRLLGSELESARRESETDPLTRLSNRKAFDDYLARTVEMFKAFGCPMCMLILDVDHFKSVNDSKGHVTGDEVLRHVANAMIKVCLRKNDFVSRLGGDEFAIILRETGVADARTLAERMLGRIRALRVPTGTQEPVAVTVSVGLAEIAVTDDEQSWFDRADRYLYVAKQAGRDRVATTA